MIAKSATTLLLVLSFRLVFSQDIIPLERSIDWTGAGSPETCMTTEQVINVLDNGCSNNGLIANDAAFTALLDTISVSTTFYFPEGVYLFEEQIQLASNTVITGAGSDLTSFSFNLSEERDLIAAKGKLKTDSSQVTSAVNRGDEIAVVADAGVFAINDYVLLIDNDSELVADDWALESTGQILKILSISGDTITFNHPTRRYYKLSNQPRLKLLEPSINIGIQNLTINNLNSTSSQKSNIYFKYVANCLVTGVASYNTNYAHIELHHATSCTVSGNYMQDAFDYGDGGKGYGILLHYNSGDNLVINNIANHLRHSYLLQAGANGNVLAYNYSINPFWTGTFLPASSAGDLVLHGNYPYANLLEGNHIQNIVIDDAHGKNGPLNTFYRNRAELYGISMSSAFVGDSMHFIGNEVTNTGFLKGLYIINGTDHIEHGNNLQGDIVPSGTESLTSSTLLNVGPPFNAGSPTIGIPNPIYSGTIPANDRFMTGELTQAENCLTICSPPTSLISSPILSDKAKLNWTSDLEKHEVNIRMLGEESWNKIRTNGSVLPISGLSPSTNYEWRVRSRCNDGWSEFSVISSFETTPLRYFNSDLSKQLYPNPSNGSFQISGYTGESIINIYNINGKLMHQQRMILENVNQMNLDLPEGMYLVNIETGISVDVYKLIIY